MIDNQRGGIISNMIMIPIGVALMIGFFFLGYYVGKYQPKSGKESEIVVPLPEVVSKALPQKDDFTFYKTLTDRENKTVSIELKPRTGSEDSGAEKSADKEPAQEKGDQAKKVEKKQAKTEKSFPLAVKSPEPKSQAERKDVASPQPQNQKIRYTLQIAAYQEKAMAEEDVKTMKRKGYAAFVVLSHLEGKGTWYRVRVGSFSNRPSAEKLQKELQAKAGVTAFVTAE